MKKKRKLFSDYFKVQNKISTIDKTEQTEEKKDNPGLNPETTQAYHNIM